MKPLRDIIVKVDKAYTSEISLNSGLIIFLDQNIKQVKDTIRYGTVVAIPEGLSIDVQIGDTLFFHHGIVAVTVMGDQPDIESPHLIDGDSKLYKVPVNESWPLAYARVRDGEFECIDGVCFVRPIIVKKYETSLFVMNNETEFVHVGELVFGNKSLAVPVGSKVVYSKDSEYKFNLNGEDLYCMLNRWILGIYETE
jgi:co-chaperonin GroES (HSP10)